MPRWPLLSRLPLTLRGLGALVLAAACGMLAQRFGIAELAYVGALLAAAVVVSAATLYLLPSSARVTRAFSPDVAAAGSEVRVRLTVEIRSSLPTSEARWRDAVPDGWSRHPRPAPRRTACCRRPGRRSPARRRSRSTTPCAPSAVDFAAWGPWHS